MEIKTLQTPLFLCTQQIYRLACIDLQSHLRDAGIMTSLHDVMLTIVDNSDLPGGRLYSPIMPKCRQLINF